MEICQLSFFPDFCIQAKFLQENYSKKHDISMMDDDIYVELVNLSGCLCMCVCGKVSKLEADEF